ncbi:unnamed protein product [Arctia plantaginis]|uniref:Uncharacterized protein n=1 Tax=Arctia plantaginis TaxID=874455 RepID=A0A8S1B7Y4_ARCPL|nr:unnamed protein product [Arctia plantaginis]
MAFGDYPKEYDPATHGPYDPARYYGKPDTPFGDVKLKDLLAWLGRRNRSPSAMLGACSRAPAGTATQLLADTIGVFAPLLSKAVSESNTA